MTECNSCKQERGKKKLPPMDKTILPVEVTAEGFKKPNAPTILCAYCDGETLIAGALRQHKHRQAQRQGE